MIARYNGDDESACAQQASLLQHAQKHSVQLFLTWAERYANPACTEGLQGLGLIKDILITLGADDVDAAWFERARSGAAGWCAPEILRVRGDALLRQGAIHAAENLLLEALDLAHQQGALAWELRCATSLARLWQVEGRHLAAAELLSLIYGRFTEGFATRDLVHARSLLDELQDKRPA